ncbi:cation-translocating P-type ATPase [Tundrisphaera sp. TA3]|uniref:cation-translocating P-type ATPase n=1 Tax=Tundrisphaera sp. TA3 TaxID=3435775 RepID=UPI003EBAD55C
MNTSEPGGRRPISTNPPGTATEVREAWHAVPAAEVAARLGTDDRRGLGEDEAAARLRQHGPNTISAAPERSPLSIFVAQFHGLMVLLLFTATAVSLILGEFVEAIAILIVILLNAIIGFLTEWRAEQALTALQKQAVAVAQVVRGGVQKEVPAADLVTGDVVIVAAGERVPADGRVVEAARLLIEEAALTGESIAVAKATDLIADPGAPLGDRKNMAFMGTTITDGRGRLIVTATGARTEMGKIGALIDAAGKQDTPLERKLAGLGQALVVIVLALCAVIVLAGYLRGIPFLPMLEIGISLAIAAVPEGLPAVTTMTLAVGMQRMARMRALVRRLPAVETLGSTTVICTDKTGTLTENQMTASVLVLDGQRVEVTGTGYAPEGEFRRGDRAVTPDEDGLLRLALRVGALCNDARIERRDGQAAVLGDPTEGALIVAAAKGGMPKEGLEQDYPRIGEIPFDSTSKRMVTVHRTPDGRAVAYLKGAAGAVLDACRSEAGADGPRPLSEGGRRKVLDDNDGLAAAALRVLALACRDLPDGHGEEDLGCDFTFAGLVGMIDPLREEARDAIATCRGAGIRTVMITGDQPATAAEIARQLGMDRDASGHPLKVVHARELEGLDDAGWERVATEAAVFARVSPEHKLRIVEALRRRREVVAMTGDGVNDAPALKAADIGIAMGIQGTEVAKESAAMIVTDDNFATIVGAVEQGRIIYANVLRFVYYLLSCNLAEILVVFVAIMIGWPMPLGTLQILWLNLITDVFPAMALAMEPSAPDMMKSPPRDPEEPLINRRSGVVVAWQGLTLAAVTLAAFAMGLRWHGGEGTGLRQASTMAFMTLALAQVAHAFNVRSRRGSAFTRRLFTNGWLWGAVVVCVALQVLAGTVPLLRRVLHTAPPSSSDWAVIGACSLAPVVVVELVKLVQRWSGPSSAHRGHRPE